MKAKLSSRERSRLSALIHRLRSETIYAARAELLDDPEVETPDLQKAREREEDALATIFAALYDDLDVEPIKRGGRS